MSMLPIPLPILFDLNFIGYIVLITTLYLPQLRRFQNITRWVLIAYTAITVILWYVLTGGHGGGIMGYADKLIEVALIVLLVVEFWQARWRKA
jgi:hypothetical protein